MSLAFALSPDALSPQVVIMAVAMVCIVTVVVATARYMWRQRAMGGHEGVSPLIAFGLVLILLATTGLLTAMTAVEAAPCVARVFGDCAPPSATATRVHTPPAARPLKGVIVQQPMSVVGTAAYPGLGMELVGVDFTQGPRQTKWTFMLNNNGAFDCTDITFGQLSLVAATGKEKHTATPDGGTTVALPHGATGIQQTVVFSFADGFAPRVGGPEYTVTLQVNVTSCRSPGNVTPTPPASTPTAPSGTPSAGPPEEQYNLYTLSGFPPSLAG